jgi:hypothetical protein
MTQTIKKSSRLATSVLVFLLVASLAPSVGGKTITRRVQFKPGTSSAVLKGAIKKGEEIVYVLRAGKGQTLSASISGTTANNDVVFSITGPGGQSLMDDIDTSFTGRLPETGDYRISVGMIESRYSQYTLKVSIR